MRIRVLLFAPAAAIAFAACAGSGGAGSGTQQSALLPSTSIGPNGIPVHIETWAGYRLGGNNNGHSSPASTVQTWLTYAESSNHGIPASYVVCNAGGHLCNSVAYVDTNNEYFGKCGFSDAVKYGGLTQQSTLDETAWVHSSAPLTYQNRIFNTANSGCKAGSQNTGLFVNRKSIAGLANALSYFNQYFQSEFSTGIPDYYMNDDTKVINSFQGHQAYEYTSWTDVQNSQGAWLAGQLNANGVPQNGFFNGCSANPYEVPGIGLIEMSPNIAGCISENNVSAKNMTKGWDMYALDNCARVSLNPNGGIFVNGIDGDTNTIMYRRQIIAFTWLCYVPGRVVTWEAPEDGAYVDVYPEEGLYPTQPLQSMLIPSGCPDATISAAGPGNTGSTGKPCSTDGHNDLAIAGTTNVFVREFAQCFNQSVPIGPCAVIWNLSGTTVTVGAAWLTQTYGHTVTMNGGTIDEGGTITLTTPITAAGTSIAPYDALLLVQ